MVEKSVTIGENIEVSFEKDPKGNDILVLKMDLSKQGNLSSTGKSYLISSTKGGIDVPLDESIKTDKKLLVNLNLMNLIPKEQRKK